MCKVSTMAVLFLLLAILAQTSYCYKYYSPLDFLRFDKAKVELGKNNYYFIIDFINCVVDATIKLVASPNALEHSGDWVTVSWSGVSYPSFEDWIGVYTPPTNGNSVDPQKQAPVKFQVRPY